VILTGSLVLYLLVTVAGESLPKAFASRAPERMLVRGAHVIRWFTFGFSPVLWVTRKLARLLALGTGVETPQTARAAHTEEEIKLLVEGSAQEGVLEEDEKELIHSIFEFTDTVVRQIMVPRIDIVSVPGTATVHEAIQEAVASGHSRLPVHDGTLDTVIGTVHVKDLIPHLLAGNDGQLVSEVVRTPFFVPPGKKIDELLQEFRTHKNQLAIVVDEFGGTAGLVTIEDVLEEIVGEIEDEYDVPEEPSVVDFPGEGTVLDARMTIDDCNAELGLDLQDEENDTIGGFVFSLFGRPPRAGERVQHGSLEFIAEAVDGIRLQRVRVLRRQPAVPATGEDTER
jgi:CBS domain containing-hemolysin-like protein